ncbi:MAG: hypothetical protein ACLR5G_10540 [Eubacteriales bacterium]
MSLFACQSGDVMIGERSRARFAGLVTPPDYDTKVAEKTFGKSGEMEDITIFLPRNEIVEDLEISVDDDASVEAPTPYRYGPMLCYGSSITEGGCRRRVTNVYSALISNHLDIDYITMAFRAARGELEIADLINRIPMTLHLRLRPQRPGPEHCEDPRAVLPPHT